MYSRRYRSLILQKAVFEAAGCTHSTCVSNFRLITTRDIFSVSFTAVNLRRCLGHRVERLRKISIFYLVSRCTGLFCKPERWCIFFGTAVLILLRFCSYVGSRIDVDRCIIPVWLQRERQRSSNGNCLSPSSKESV
jgi:hypothetical protein